MQNTSEIHSLIYLKRGYPLNLSRESEQKNYLLILPLLQVQQGKYSNNCKPTSSFRLRENREVSIGVRDGLGSLKHSSLERNHLLSFFPHPLTYKMAQGQLLFEWWEVVEGIGELMDKPIS